MASKSNEKNEGNHRCEKCAFVCSYLSDYTRHVSTRKHKMLVNASNTSQKYITEFSCACGKNYKHDSSYYKHKKICKYIEEKNPEECPNGQNIGGENNDLVVQLMNIVVEQGKQMSTQQQQSSDLQNLVVPLVKQVNEIIPKIGNINCNNNTTNNNTTNNKFNLSIYLNEKCKDAIPLMDFIDNLKITDIDYDTTRTEGIVNGLNDIFTKELRNLDVRQLPIHCSDIKRETFYIKNDDEWVKDDSEKTILSKAICKAKDKANKFLPNWLEDHPLCWKQDNNYHNEWMDIVTVRYGKGDPNFNEKNTKKILKNLAQEVFIDKETAMIDEEE